MTEANYVVVRPGPGLSDGFLPPGLDGKWFDMSNLPLRFGQQQANGAVAVPSGRFEVRGDGAVAEVYEVQV